MYETSRVFIKSKYELIAIKYKKINKGKHIKISYLYRNKNDRRILVNKVSSHRCKKLLS